ncbi:flagellar basal body L-ring protein FlgH [Uliginosibacterium sp. H3]|uniref:Flagellar L-ring protein n=1 Tax=Uliginosibacterium silvisoli TaxID=3114758 RepID=A0ABU6K6U4_9RHOO|nr:flagellar basal body L-ring protein FlgH [Uliginosibacterium sp. H3]
MNARIQSALRPVSYSLGTASLAMLSACSLITPATSVHQPMSVRPEPAPVVQAYNGSIYGAATRPIFEDRRARLVGDTLTVNIVEKTQASKNANTNTTRAANSSVGISSLVGVPGKFLAPLSVGASDDTTFSGKGASAANNAFTGTMTVTVIEVYPNGNLLVSGEKQVAINQGQEFIRFSGVVNPNNVTSSNTVQSVQVADARVEYRGSGYVEEAQRMGWLQRIFMNVLPF